MDIEFPPGTPEEVQAYMQSQYDRQHMHMQAENHERWGFFEGLSQDQLIALRKVLEVSDRVEGMLDYFMGVVAARLRFEFNVCPNCGVDHDKEVLGEMSAPPVPVIIQTEDIPQGIATLAFPPSHPPHPPFTDPGPPPADPTCTTCHGDLYLPVCSHPAGSHGQEKTPCPEPIRVPCPECRCPGWYTASELDDSNCHAGLPGKWLPLDEPGQVICSACGKIDRLL